MKKLRQDAEAYARLRRKVLKRDGWKCQNCGSKEQLDVHHIIPRSRGGEDDERNLVTLCRTCHNDSIWLRLLSNG